MAEDNTSDFKSGEENGTEGQEALRRIRSDYGQLLAKAENEALNNRLQVIEDKYNQVASLERRAESEPLVGLESDNLLMQADQELRQLENDIGEVWWSSLSLSERQLFDRRSQAEIEEMQRLMKRWSQGTFPGVAESIVYHSNKYGYSEFIEYLRDASNFSRVRAARTPSEGLRDDGTVRWETMNNREFIVVDEQDKVLTYGFNAEQ